MTTSTNPSTANRLLSGLAAGDLVFDKHTFDLADVAYGLPALALNDLVEIGIVPRGHRLVPQLCRFDIPIIDDGGGSQAAEHTIGTAADPDAIKGSQAAETAVTLFGEDIIVATAEIGSDDEDTPIYLKVITATVNSPATTGSIVSHLVYRKSRQNID